MEFWLRFLSAVFLRPERRVQAPQLSLRVGRGRCERGEALPGGRSVGGDEPDAVGDAVSGGGAFFRWDLGRLWRSRWIWYDRSPQKNGLQVA